RTRLDQSGAASAQPRRPRIKKSPGHFAWASFLAIVVLRSVAQTILSSAFPLLLRRAGGSSRIVGSLAALLVVLLNFLRALRGRVLRTSRVLRLLGHTGGSHQERNRGNGQQGRCKQLFHFFSPSTRGGSPKIGVDANRSGYKCLVVILPLLVFVRLPSRSRSQFAFSCAVPPSRLMVKLNPVFTGYPARVLNETIGMWLSPVPSRVPIS